MKIQIHKSARAYTMIEVLVAGTILAMATFMVVGLLKLSDEMSYRAKVDAKVAQIMKSRATMLVNMSFERLKSIAMASPPGGSPNVSPNKYEFVRGRFTAAHVSNALYRFAPNSKGFPFLEAYDPVTVGQSGDIYYLISGKPLPGTSTPRDIFPFVEIIRLQFTDANNNPIGPTSSDVYRVNIQYDIWWVNEFIRSTVVVDPAIDTSGKVSSIGFEFFKYDPSKY